MEQAGVALIAQGANVYISDMGNATKATDSFVSTTEKGSGRVSAAGQVIIGGLREIGKVTVDVFKEAAKATASFLKGSVDVAGDFEASFNRFKIAAGKGVDTAGLERFRDLFIQLGRELPVSTTEVEQAATEMVSGGIDPAIVAGGALRQTLQFAAASGLSLADAAATSAKFLAGWTDSAATTGQKVAFLAESTDALTKAAAASSTTAGELRLGLFNVQGAAQALHAPFDDVVATLGLLAPAFESSAQAGTALNVFMTRLVPSTNPATDAMKALGIITAKNQNLFFNAKGGFLGMANAAQVLKEHMGSLTDEQKISTLHTLFGNDAMKVGNLLMHDGAKGLQEFIAKMQQQAGVQEAAKTAQEGYNVAVENAKGSVEALQITLATKLLPSLTTLLNDYIAPSINSITTFADKILNASDPVLSFAYSLGNVSKPLEDIAIYLVEAWRSGDLLNDWLTETPPLFQGLIGGVQGAVKEFSRLSDAFNTGGLSKLIDTLLSDIGAAVPDIQAKLGEWGQSFVDFVKPYIPPFLAKLGELAVDAWGWIQQQAPQWLKQLGVWGEQLSGWIQPYIPIALKALGDLVNDAWGWVKQQAPEWLKQLGAWGEQLGAFVEPYIPVAIKALGDLVSEAWGWVKEQAPGWGKQLLTWGSELAAWIAPAIPPAIAELGELGNQFLVWIGEQATPLVKKFNDWATSFVSWIPGATVQFLAEWPKTFDKFLDWIGSEAGPLLKKLGDWAVSFTAWIVPMIPGFLLTLAGVSAAILVFIAETAVVLANKLLVWAGAMLDWVEKSVLPKLPGIFESLWVSARDLIGGIGMKIGDAMLGVGKSLVDGLKQGIGNAWADIKNYLHDLAMGLPAWFRDWWGIKSPAKEFIPIGQFAVQGIMQGFSNMWPALLDQVSTMSDDLIKQAADLGRAVQDAFADGFGAVASIDRQMAANLGKLKDVLPEYLDYTKGALKEAQQQAQAFLDPTEGAKFFKMRSDQILEYAGLQKDLADANKSVTDAVNMQFNQERKIDDQHALLAAAAEKRDKKLAEATDDKQRDAILAQYDAEANAIDIQIAKIQEQVDAQIAARNAAQQTIALLQQQMLLINAAQTATLQEYTVRQQGQKSPLQDLIDQIGQLFNNSRKADLEKQLAAAKTQAERDRIQAELNAASLPVNDTGVGHDLMALLQQLEQFLGIVPHLAAGGIAHAGQPHWVGEHGPELFWPGITGMVSPAASSQQIAAHGPVYNGQVGNTYNTTMPIYTNNSPGAIQQSWAIVQASMP